MFIFVSMLNLCERHHIAAYPIGYLDVYTFRNVTTHSRDVDDNNCNYYVVKHKVAFVQSVWHQFMLPNSVFGSMSVENLCTEKAWGRLVTTVTVIQKYAQTRVPLTAHIICLPTRAGRYGHIFYHDIFNFGR